MYIRLVQLAGAPFGGDVARSGETRFSFYTPVFRLGFEHCKYHTHTIFTNMQNHTPHL